MFWLYSVPDMILDWWRVTQSRFYNLDKKTSMIRFLVKFPGETPYLYGVLSIELNNVFCENRKDKYHMVFQMFHEFQAFCEKIDKNYRIVWVDKR